MIDYGFSHVMSNGENFGIFGFEEHGVFPNAGRPWYDIYKILMFSLFTMINLKNKACYTEGLNLVRMIMGLYDYEDQDIY